MNLRACLLLISLATASMGAAQAWSDAYQKGIASAKSEDWALARSWFQRAALERGPDEQGPITLPGPVTDPRVWRGGAPYSPNFAAAYSGYRLAFELTDSRDRSSILTAVATELDGVLKGGQHSWEAYAILNQTFTLLGDDAKRTALEEMRAKQKRIVWKIDTEVLAAADAPLITAYKDGILAPIVKPPVENPPAQNPPAQGPTPPPDKDETKPPTGPVTPDVGTQRGGGSSGTKPAPNQTPTQTTFDPNAPVPTQPNKFALIIGNSESRIVGGTQAFAASDAEMVRATLAQHAGYANENITVLTNATAAQMRAAAQTLAEKMPDGATLFVFFSGVGVYIGDRDYLAGIDSGSEVETSTMLPKADLLRPFLAKSARIFSFYQTSRATREARAFGRESFGGENGLVGAVSQMMATVEGERALGVIEAGKPSGLFAVGLCRVLQDFRSNTIPILEYGWQVFYAMRGGKAGQTGGGSLQTPTLPTLTFLDQNARF